jgi:hypothetical protein
MAHWKVNEIRLCAMRNVEQTFCPKLLSAERTLFNCLLQSLFIYVYLTFKLPTQLVVFPFGHYLLS